MVWNDYSTRSGKRETEPPGIYGMVNGGRIPEPSTGLGVPWRVGRRCRHTPPTAFNVGAGIPDGPGRQCYAGASRMPRPTDGWYKKGRRPPPADGVGTAALRHTPRGLRHLRMALWNAGVFRPLRRAGVSRRARRGSFARCDGRVVRPVRGATRGSASGRRDFLKKIE